MQLIILLLLYLASCGAVQPVDQPKSTESPKRYAINQQNPLILSKEIAFMAGHNNYLPNIFFLTKSGEIYLDDNFQCISGEDHKEVERRVGLGPSYVFNKIDETKYENKDWFDKGSMKFTYEDNKVRREYNDLIKEGFVDRMNLGNLRDSLGCDIYGTGELYCGFRSSWPPPGESLKKRAIGGQKNNPVVELSDHAYPGSYFLTQDGRLWHFRSNHPEVTDAKNVNSDVKFLKNSQGRYFINAASEEICLQSDQLSIYCYEHNKLGKYLGPDSAGHPHLKKVFDVDFQVEEVAYSGRHACLLSSAGEVFCTGDNSCGQITGRYVGRDVIKSLQKIDFLDGPAKQLFTYSGGTCVLLQNGNLQCFGLGASVKRNKILEPGKYYRSFSYVHGFRPEHICGGGAEEGL